jgi:hypothetical protein
MTLPLKKYNLASGPEALAVECDAAGVRLAGVALLRRAGTAFEPRPNPEISGLLEAAYGAHLRTADVVRGLQVASKALTDGDLSRAMIATLHLRLPPLDNEGACRVRRYDEQLAKYDPDEPRDWHGRWTTGGGGSAAATSSEAQPHDASGSPALSQPSQHAPAAVQDKSTSITPNSADLLVDAAYNGFFHDEVVRDYANYLRSKGQIVETEVPLVMADGSVAARLDILAKDPLTQIVYAVEVKTGLNPGFTPGQIVVYPHLMLGESVMIPDMRAMEFGLLPNVPLPAIPLYLMSQRDGKSEPSFTQLDPRKMSRYYRGY